MRTLQEYPDREIMMLDLADRLASELGDHLRRHDGASLCVPGGSTPGPAFDVLSEQKLDWDRVAVFLNDERWVDEDDERSNTRLLRERLLVSRASAAKLIPLKGPGRAPEDDAAALAEGLKPHLPISVLVLGMGGDMHTASLIPGADTLDAALKPDAPILLPVRVDSSAVPRITLSARVLDEAMSKHILITGDEKREALDRAAHLDAKDAPIRAVWRDATVHWAP
ncbi:6-phosphogluconolactonase [Rhodobacterales bacterium HKCCE2091]|nr:6-phosphogluconolactonase [Rhodobacterales bacterium HKCCE2091]